MDHNHLLPLFVLAFALCKVCAAQECGTLAGSHPKIVGGTEASPGSWPWIVSLSYGKSPYCGGSLISELWILTAAHCIDAPGMENLTTIYLGRHNVENVNDTVTRGIDSVWCHPQYNLTGESDICLLKMSAPVKFTDLIRPLCLSDEDSTFPAGYPSWAAGWGALDESNEGFPDVLQEVKMPIVGINKCRCLNWLYIPEKTICAGYEKGGFDTCQGDSGGPLIVGRSGVWAQVGIVSFGEGCARPNKPGAYTLVSAFQDWINEIVGDEYPPTFVEFDPPEEDRDLDYVCQNKSIFYDYFYNPVTVSGSREFFSPLLSLCAIALLGVVMM